MINNYEHFADEPIHGIARTALLHCLVNRFPPKPLMVTGLFTVTFAMCPPEPVSGGLIPVFPLNRKP